MYRCFFLPTFSRNLVSDPCDLNLDLYCTELLCECEAILERLPEGDEDDHFVFERSVARMAMDEAADDGDDGGD